MSNPAVRAREHVLKTHAETLEAVLRSADAVADDWEGEATTDRNEVAAPLRAVLEAGGVWSRLPEMLAGAVEAAGYSLSAPPVPDPPYVAVTSRGPILRATVADGRLVVLVKVFEVARDPTRYVRGPTTPEAAVRVEFE